MLSRRLRTTDRIIIIIIIINNFEMSSFVGESGDLLEIKII